MDVKTLLKENRESKYKYVRKPMCKFDVVDSDGAIMGIISQRGLINPLDITDDSNMHISAMLDVEYNHLESDVIEDFTQWKSSLEYQVGNPNISSLLPQMDDSAKSEYYDMLFVGMVLLRNTRNNIAATSKAVSGMLDWLHRSDFYAAPASAKYHDAVPGGLLSHSLKVYREACMMWNQIDKFKTVSCESMALATLLHDWCKIGLYEQYKRNEKTDYMWIKRDAYRLKDSARAFVLGHGTSSLHIAQKFFNLSMEEACAIRWHMGAWCVSDYEKNELRVAGVKYPLVHLVQFADELSLVQY